MNVTVLTGSNLAVITNEILAAVRKNVGFVPTFVLVPDRFTLQAERILLERGGTMLNTRVVTFSMLFSVLADELTRGGSVKVIDKTTAVLYLWRAIRSVKLNWFGGSSRYFDFAEKMFNAINQIKSSLVKFDELESIAKTTVARKKFADISAVEKEYRKLLSEDGAVDSSGMLAYLIDNIRSSKLFSAANFYICGFGNLSKARLRVVTELCKLAGSVHIGAAAGSELDRQIKSIKKTAKIMASSGTTVGDNARGIFSYNFTEKDLEFCEIGVFDTVQAEAETVCNRIAKLARTGVNLGDITVLLGDFENTAAQWETVFNSNGIPVNIDVGKRLSEFTMAKYLHELVEVSVNPNAENTVAVLFNDYSGVKEDDLFTKENEIISRSKWAAADGVALLSGTDTVELCGELIAIAELEKEEFVRNKLQSVLNAIKLSGVKLSLTEFGELFWALAVSAKVSNIPLYKDRVLIAPVDDFVATTVPYLFLCNCADGMVPKGQDDSELLLESDTKGTDISPKPSEQRERNRRHLVDIIGGVTQRMSLSSYRVNTSGEGVSMGTVITNLRKQGAAEFSADDVLTPGLATLHLLTDDCMRSTYAAALGIPDNVCLPPNSAARHNICLPPNSAAAHVCLPPYDEKISCGRELFFPQKTVRPTMVERFYSCPYLNYIENGLRIRQRQLYELKPNIIGSIIHDIIYEYFNAKIKGKKLAAGSAIDLVFTDGEYSFYCTDKRNLPLINALRKEAEFIIDKLDKNLADADLQPYRVEYNINRMLPNGYELHGRADRVDRCIGGGGAEYYAVLDYKTGTEESGIPKKIYMGEKLQLPLYSAYFLKCGYNVVGAGYLPLSKGFAKGEKNIQLNGFVDEKLAAMFDRKIGTDGYKSKTINENQRIDGEIIRKICAYADAMVIAAVDKISNGYIEPNPIDKDICKYCAVRSTCPQCETVRRTSVTVNYGSFMGGA